MIIGAFADQVIKELGYFTSEKKLDRRNVIVRADSKMRGLLAALSYDGVYAGGGEWRVKIDTQPTELPDNLFISRTAPVVYDNTRAQHYVTVPTEYVSFKNMNGIRWVSPTQDRTDGFINQKAGSSGAYYLLESSALGGAKGYEIEGQNLYLNNFPLNTYTELLITYLPALLGLKETDIMPMSGEIADMLMTAVRDSFMLQKATPENKTTDSNSE